MIIWWSNFIWLVVENDIGNIGSVGVQFKIFSCRLITRRTLDYNRIVI